MSDIASETAKRIANWLCSDDDPPSVEDLAFVEKCIDAACAAKDEFRIRQLAAISTAAYANTVGTADETRIGMSHELWSAAYDDVCKAVNREMALRQTCEMREQEIARLKEDVNDLNNLLRAAGWGQGEIDSSATVVEECESRIAALESLLKRVPHDKNGPWVKVPEGMAASCTSACVACAFEKLREGKA